MARFTPKEKEIIKKYKLDNLLTSLSEIRECMEDLWSEDAPRILQDFTNHGEDHCERLVGLVDKILEANNGKRLNGYEMYLLLVGIYLHDIGMQCDIVKYPEIKKEAEKLGAKFDLDFTAGKSSKYIQKEQNLIRENHHYLSAAWISYAHKTKKTVVGSAIQKIPETLISDLIDVCMYVSFQVTNNRLQK